MTSRLPSTYRRNLPPWSPDLIQRFVPWEELRRPDNYTPKRSRKRRDDPPPFDPFR